jgi:hypothetical protein
LKGCPPRHYRDENDDCFECDASCEGCYGPDPTQCDWCEESKHNHNGECITCAENEYFEGEDGICKACEFGCSRCYNKDDCETCLDTYLMFDEKCYSSGECPLGTEENSDGTECYRNTNSFEVFIWEEEEDSDKFKYMFDIEFNEKAVETNSYLEFTFPPNAVFEEGVSSCQEREGDGLEFVSFLDGIALYEILREFYIEDMLHAECTQLTKVQNNSSIL